MRNPSPPHLHRKENPKILKETYKESYSPTLYWDADHYVQDSSGKTDPPCLRSPSSYFCSASGVGQICSFIQPKGCTSHMAPMTAVPPHSAPELMSAVDGRTALGMYLSSDIPCFDPAMAANPSSPIGVRQQTTRLADSALQLCFLWLWMLVSHFPCSSFFFFSLCPFRPSST